MRAAVVQLNSTEDTERNLERADALTREAAAARGRGRPAAGEVDGARDRRASARRRPDARRSGDRLGPRDRRRARDRPDRRLDRRCAREAGLTNTSVHVGPDGEIARQLRQAPPVRRRARRRPLRRVRHRVAGRPRRCSAELADGIPVGLTVCYDLRFPELYGELAARGAEVLIDAERVHAGHHARPLGGAAPRAGDREQRASCWPPTRSARTRPGNRSGGRSMIVDPWGVVLAAVPDREGVAVAELDRDALRDIRRRLPSLAHRRDFDYAAMA